MEQKDFDSLENIENRFNRGYTMTLYGDEKGIRMQMLLDIDNLIREAKGYKKISEIALQYVENIESIN